MMLTPRTVLLASIVLGLGVRVRADDIQFNRDIRPILNENCFRCHGPAAKKGGFRLDEREDAVKPAKSKLAPIVPGKPAESEVIKRIFSEAADEMMPPPNSHKSLKPAQKEMLKKWIAEGAKYQKHWSFEAAVKSSPPLRSGLAVGSNPIDAFIADRLKRDGLTLSPEADRATLIRRVAFALTGLPPTIAEVDGFLNDKSADAYEKMVDRYLASKHFGEEMARHWLDLARYADTHGLHLDNERSMWLYRDWVVRAFNDNMPFDRFTVEQLAGDLLPKATSEQIIATGFNRCNVSTSEGGSIDQEWVFRNALDRTSTTMEVFLALTGGCAVCHDHKFDPISAKEYYSMFAFFYSAAGPAMDGNALLTEPVMKAPSSAQQKRLAELTELIAKTQQDLSQVLKALKYVDPADAKEPSKLASDPTRSFKAWRVQAGKDQKGIPKEIVALIKQAKLDAAGEKKLLDHYVQNIWAETKTTLAPLNTQLASLTKERDGINGAIPGTFIFKDLPQPRPSFVMMRGQYDKPGEKVEPNTPAALPPLVKADAKARANRLDLANWLVTPNHPLTARVAVNRYWQQFFGTGLVKSSADFGVQGELPSHPELLDYLAVEFSSPLPPAGEGPGVRGRSHAWDIKAMVRLMVTSQTFRQSSRVTPDLIKRDPDNRLYARGPRFRLDAEQIRDNALYVSGLINLELGGRGVRPYQPPRIWEPVAFSGSNTGTYTQDKGTGLYRRSLYTFIKRTAPHPFMSNFDAPNRESSCSRRERSNTPLQALQLMNDVQHFEAARSLAERMLIEGGKTPAERIRFGYRVVLSRSPEAFEMDIVDKTLQQYLTRYQKDVESAKKAIRVGDSAPRTGLAEPGLAAYTLIANLLLNLDETLSRN
jgi:dsDNA-binding SOS-regulon protein